MITCSRVIKMGGSMRIFEKEYVGWLYIPMDQAIRMDILERAANLLHDDHSLLRRKEVLPTGPGGSIMALPLRTTVRRRRHAWLCLSRGSRGRFLFQTMLQGGPCAVLHLDKKAEVVPADR